MAGKDYREDNSVNSTRSQYRSRNRNRKNNNFNGLIILAIILIGAIFVGSRFLIRHMKKNNTVAATNKGDGSINTDSLDTSVAVEEAESTSSALEVALNTAKKQAMQYDYDAAIATLNELNMPDNAEVTSAISEYEGIKANLVPANMDDITHVFFHTMVVDVDRALRDTHQGRQWNSVMTTIPEFKEILQQMYDRGYVMVHLHDIAQMQDQGDGTMKMVKNQIMLPEGKIPFVMSQDDVNYYIYMENHGFPDKMVLDENGKLKNQYTDAQGNVTVGDYDLVPILDAFVEEHPDFAYHGHKAIIALTGYNGVLGYRTDETFDPNSPAFDPNNKPNHNIEEDRSTVRTLTSALKQDGYEFASHSWGHINFKGRSLGIIQNDTDKWIRNVGHLLPDPCEILIYPFGADIGDWHPYQAGHQEGKFDYLESVGFRYFCNVDSKRAWLQYGDNFFRQGRRNLDGYRLYEGYSGKTDRLSDIIDVTKVFDTSRPTPINWE